MLAESRLCHPYLVGSHAWCHSLGLSRIAGVERHPCKRRHSDCTTVRPRHSSGVHLRRKPVAVKAGAGALLAPCSGTSRPCLDPASTLPDVAGASQRFNSISAALLRALLRRDKPPPALHAAASDAHDVALPCVHARTLTRVNA
jgi:hypothetical protein